MTSIEEDNISTENESRLTIKVDKKATRLFLRILIMFIAIIMITTICLAWWQYPEKYEFFREFVSNLGGNYSEHGFDNQISKLIMIIGFTTVALVTLAIAITYFIKKVLRFNISKGVFSLFLTIGAVGIAIPKDQPGWELVHGIGAFLFIFGFALFNFIAQLLRYLRRNRHKPKKGRIGFYIDVLVTSLVFSAMIIFLLFYLLERVASGSVPDYLAELSQKMVLIVDCIAVFVLDVNDM